MRQRHATRLRACLLPVMLASAPALAWDNPDSYISDCNKSQGLSYCQQQAQTLNGGESNTMKGLNDFMKLMRDLADRRKQESHPAADAAPAFTMSPEAREELHAWQREQAAMGSSMVPSIKLDREETWLPVTWSRSNTNESSALEGQLSRDAFEGDPSEDQVRAALVRMAQWDLGWKIPPRECFCTVRVAPPSTRLIDSFEMITIAPLKKVIKAEKKYPGNAYALEAHFYLGKLYLYGLDKAVYMYFGSGYKDVKEDPDDAMEEFAAVLDYLRLDPKKNSRDVMELSGQVKGQQHTVLAYQHPIIVLAAYELIRGYRDGIGVKKDPAKAQALARELLERLAPLHPDLSFFMANPLAERADPKKRGMFDAGNFESVKDIMEPALYAWAQAHPQPVSVPAVAPAAEPAAEVKN